MPTTLKIKSAKGFKSAAYSPAMKTEQKAEFDKLRQPVVEQFEKRVRGWSSNSRPKFQARSIPTEKGFTFVVIVTGSQKQKDIWKQLDSEGRKGGKEIQGKPSQFQPIQGKHGQYMARRYLRFRHDYTPKTTPIDQFGGTGRRHGPWVRKKIVTQGPVTPREFSKTILETYFRKEFRLAARRGYERSFEKAKRSGQI
jgi:hypothetical protein